MITTAMIPFLPSLIPNRVLPVHTFIHGLTVAELIEAENIDNPLYVTVSVNEEFVEGGTFDKAVLKDGDSVEFLYFMGGGC